MTNGGMTRGGLATRPTSLVIPNGTKNLYGAGRERWQGFLRLSPAHSFLGFHGSPTSFHNLIFPYTPEEEFQKLLSPYARHILADGHTHLPQLRRIGDNFFFNPGSVGLAYNTFAGIRPRQQRISVSVKAHFRRLQQRQRLLRIRQNLVNLLARKNQRRPRHQRLPQRLRGAEAQQVREKMVVTIPAPFIIQGNEKQVGPI